MDTNAQHVLDQAMKLPADAREVLAVHLMDSVATPAEQDRIKQLWVEEGKRRTAAIDSGELETTPIEEAWPKLTGKPWKNSAGDDA